MRIVTGKHHFDGILFPEQGKNDEELKKFVSSLEGDEKIVTASLELIDLILERFKKNGRWEAYILHHNEKLNFKRNL